MFQYGINSFVLLYVSLYLLLFLCLQLCYWHLDLAAVYFPFLWIFLFWFCDFWLPCSFVYQNDMIKVNVFCILFIVPHWQSLWYCVSILYAHVKLKKMFGITKFQGLILHLNSLESCFIWCKVGHFMVLQVFYLQ